MSVQQQIHSRPNSHRSSLTIIKREALGRKNLLSSNELTKVELPPSKVQKADVSSVSPSSERIEELWGVVGLYERVEELCHWWKHGHMNL